MKIYDSVLGFIHLTPLETRVVSLLPFKRLHGIHQLGGAFFVYPGASHKRYEHSLGTMFIANQIFEQVIEKRDLKEFDLPFSVEYSKLIVRLGALLHDLGHLPLSHVCEEEVFDQGGHEAWTAKILSSSYFDDIWAELDALYPGRCVRDDVIKVAIGEKKCKEIGVEDAFLPWEEVLSSIVTGDLFGADRIDYLMRDAHFSGLKYGIFDYKHLIENLTLAIEGGDKYVLAIRENGLDACDSLLIARHFMFKRLYHYPTVKEYNFHLGSFAVNFLKEHQVTESIENYFKVIDYDILSAIYRAFWKSDGNDFHAQALFDPRYRFKAVPLSSPEKVSIAKEWMRGKNNTSILNEINHCKISDTFVYPLSQYGGEVFYKSAVQYPATNAKIHGWIYTPPTEKSELMKELC